MWFYGSVQVKANMAETSHGKKVGRPRKYAGGWESANRRICISNKTYEEWKRLKVQQRLENDDSVARYLSRYHVIPVTGVTN